MRTKPAVALLALSSLFFAILQPPEAHPSGKLAVVLCATFVYLITLVERKIPFVYVKIGAVVFGLLLFHTFTTSIDLYRSLEMITVLWAYYCLIGFFMFASHGLEKHLAGAMVALSLIVSGYGLYQYFWGFDQIYQYIFYAASDQLVKAPALNIVSSRRVFSTLSLPGTLWGFLVCALPFHLPLWRKNRLLDVTLILSAAMLLTTGFLTRSFGFLLGLFVLVVCATWLRYRKLLWNRVTPVLIVLVILGALFYTARQGVIIGENPAGLRFKNWVSAWSVFASNPMGTGLNTFGVVYPEHMQPFANETQYAHNTPLQLLSELGYLFIASVIVVLLIASGAVSRRKPDPFRACLLVALAAWITHNFVDINVYFPSVGVLGAVLIGTVLSRQQRQFPTLPKAVMAGTVIFAVGMILFSGAVCLSNELQYRAQIELDNKKLTTAVETLGQAMTICPINSSLHHDAGEIQLNLFHTTHEQHYLDEATQSFQTAIRLSPRKAGSYVGYGLCLSTASRIPEAIAEIKRAQQLYPSSTYIQSIAQLMEKRLQ